MSALDDSLDIIEPEFDRPVETIDISEPLTVGTRVSLIYRGSLLGLQVETIERLGTSFVGRVRDVTGELPLVRFRLRDVASID